jgi:hypothetical protein
MNQFRLEQLRNFYEEEPTTLLMRMRWLQSY